MTAQIIKFPAYYKIGVVCAVVYKEILPVKCSYIIDDEVIQIPLPVANNDRAEKYNRSTSRLDAFIKKIFSYSEENGGHNE